MRVCVCDYTISCVCLCECVHIEGSRPEWCISSMIYSRDRPFWSGTLDIYQCEYSITKHEVKKAALQVLLPGFGRL